MTATIVDPANPVELNVSVQVNPAPADLIRKIMKVSSGDTNIGNGHYAAVTSSSWTTIFTGDKSTTETYLWLQAFFAQAPDKTAYVLEATAVDDLADFIENGTAPMYQYFCPAAWYESGPYYTGEFITLVKSKTAVTDPTYFAIEITHGVSPAEDQNFLAYAKAKSLFPIYGNAVADESVPGAIAGVMASSIYDLSQANPATMMNYKRLNGITPEVLDASLRADLNNNGCNYAADFSGNTVLFNGRYADLNTWDYWYNWDWLQINLLNTVSAAMVNGSNVPAAAIRFNQNGIDALKSICNGVCTLGMTDGTVTGFGGGYNITTGLITNPNTFSAVPFAAYIAANPSDYEAGIYRGLSAYVQIGRFIRQVILNVVIN